MTVSDTLLIRLPNWLGDVVMTLPVIRALEPNYKITLRGMPAFAPILAQCFPNMAYDPLPPRESGYYRHFWQYRGRFKHGVLFTNSERGDWEMVLSGVKERYGLIWSGRKRVLVNHRYLIANPDEEATIHQTQQWADMVTHFGLAKEVGFMPFSPPAVEKKNNIVMICGSANNPAKRWSISHYRELILRLLLHYPHATITLTGSQQDAEITAAVARGLPKNQVNNIAGKTTLAEFVNLVCGSRCAIGNDTGGLHLANAFGVPTVAIFGPTNPLRSAPIFMGENAVVQPLYCSETGGGEINDISVEQIFQAVRQLIK